MAYIDTICELSMHITFYFFFLSRWVLERVELEAGPEHPRIKIVPEDWFLWFPRNKIMEETWMAFCGSSHDEESIA